MAERIFDLQGFSGGESDDFYKGPANSFYSGENIEIRKNLSGVQIEAVLADTGWTFDSEITCMVALDTLGIVGGGIITCLSNGKIYLNGGSETTGALKTTLATGTASWDRIYGVGVNEVSGTQYVYFISSTSHGTGKIHRSTIALDFTGGVSYRTYTVSSGTTSFIGIIQYTGYLYIATKNKVFIMDTNEVITDYLTLPAKEEIKGFTQYLGNFTVYSNYANTGVQYKWDGASAYPDYRQEWVNQPVLGVANDGAIDYAVLGFNELYSDLYRIDGTQKTELRVNLEISNNSRLLNGYISIREGIVFISGGQSGESNNYGVYTYGNYYPGTAKSLVQSYSGTTSGFLQQCHSVSSSYMACANNKVYVTSHNNPPSVYNTTGYLVSQIYQGNVWEELEFNRMKVGFKLNGGQIDIYVRTDFTGNFVLLKSIPTAEYSSVKFCKITPNDFLALNLGFFSELQIKVILTAKSDKTASPILKRITTWLNSLNDK